MTPLDWIVVGLYVVIALVLGFVFVRKASHDTTDFFVAGRTLPWWVAGTSLVATTFSTDTPLFVAGIARNDGISGNWFWWSAAIGQTATIFFFAKLWRRTKVLTDVEFIQCRYEPTPERSVLRVFKVLFDGIYVNCYIMASVTIAATKVVQAVMGLGHDPVFAPHLFGSADPIFTITETGAVLLILGFCAMAYSMASGLYGVVYTDLVQFGLAMVGTIWLAIVAYHGVMHEPVINGVATEGMSFAQRIQATSAYNPDKHLLSFFPPMHLKDLATITFLTYIFVVSWQNSPGSGYLVQRMLATKSEKDSLLAFLWYNFCHYVIRPWPWIVVGLASMVFFPELTGHDAERAFPLMIDKMMHTGIKGVIVAAMLAAYMSTLDTHLNWGSSYLVNDVYQPFVRPGAKQKELVLVSRISMLCLTILALIVSTTLKGILDTYLYLGVILGGLGTVLILRWYWWRVTAWSEISAIIGAVLIGNAVEHWLANPVDAQGQEVSYFAYRMIVTTIGTTLVWVVVSLLTYRKPSASTINFCKQVRPSGPGWARVRRQEGIPKEPGEFGRSATGWLASTVFIYSLLLGIGSAIFTRWTAAAVCLVLAAAAGFVLRWVVKRSLFGQDDELAEDQQTHEEKIAGEEAARAELAGKKRGLAVSSFVCALLGISIPAVVLGHVALVRIKRDPETHGDRDTAIVGLVFGYLWFTIEVVLLSIWVLYWITHTLLHSGANTAVIS